MAVEADSEGGLDPNPSSVSPVPGLASGLFRFASPPSMGAKSFLPPCCHRIGGTPELRGDCCELLFNSNGGVCGGGGVPRSSAFGCCGRICCDGLQLWVA